VKFSAGARDTTKSQWRTSWRHSSCTSHTKKRTFRKRTA